MRASVSGKQLSPSGMTVDEFKEKSVEENDLFALREEHIGVDKEEKMPAVDKKAVDSRMNSINVFP